MTTATPSIAEPARPRSPWFKSAAFDMLLILGVPFFTWPLVMAGTVAWGPDLFNSLILLTATGHYFATFVRTYGDRELFRRFQTRFVLVPILLLVTCIGMFTSGNGPSLLIVTVGWAFWHWLAQAFGFARIYDIKVGSFRPLTAWLDKALVITGFVGAVVLNDGATAEFAKAFLSAGFPLPTAAQFEVVEQLVLGAMILVGIAYFANLATTIVRGQPWSWQKQFMHVTTIGYYWFAFAWLPNVLVAYVLYELFHDIQYYAITWLTCRQRVRRPEVTPWLSRMFRPGWAAAFGFIVLMTAFGGVDALGRGGLSPQEPAGQVWLGVFVTFALLHYYYDGFIWKARESALGADLGIQGGLRAAVGPGLRHAAHWALFFVPMVAVMVLGKDNRDISQRERVEALVALAPGDFLNQAELGLEMMKTRELSAAIEHYKASIAINPNLAQTRSNYGSALDFVGDLDGAREQYEAALQCSDYADTHQHAHINLGVLLMVQGDRTAAEEHFKAGRALGGEDPIGRMMALAEAVPAENVERRKRLYWGVLQLDANHLDARFRLASLLQQQRRFNEASDHFEFIVQRKPNMPEAMIHLAGARAEMGQIGKARAMLLRALRLAPNDPMALALKARLGIK